jgi:hypothetical protein
MYNIGEAVVINCKDGWGGRFHKDRGTIESLEPNGKFRVRVEYGPYGEFDSINHSLLCSPCNVLKVFE